jgi:hypothetical protein
LTEQKEAMEAQADLDNAARDAAIADDLATALAKEAALLAKV